MMLEAPPIPSGGWRGAIVERHDIGGEVLFSVTTRRRFGVVERTWHERHGAALAYALEQADRHELPAIDLAGEEGEPG